MQPHLEDRDDRVFGIALGVGAIPAAPASILTDILNGDVERSVTWAEAAA